MGISLLQQPAWDQYIRPTLVATFRKHPKGHPARAAAVTRAVKTMRMLTLWSTLHHWKETVKRRCCSQVKVEKTAGMKRSLCTTETPLKATHRVIILNPVLDPKTNSYNLGSVVEVKYRIREVKRETEEVIDLTLSEDDSDYPPIRARPTDGNKLSSPSHNESKSSSDDSYDDDSTCASGDDSDTSLETATWSEIEELKDPMKGLSDCETEEQLDAFLSQDTFKKTTQELIDTIYANHEEWQM